MKDPLSEMSWYSSTHEWATASGANRTKAKRAGSRAHMVEHLVDAVGRCMFVQYDETGRVVWVWGTVWQSRRLASGMSLAFVERSRCREGR